MPRTKSVSNIHGGEATPTGSTSVDATKLPAIPKIATATLAKKTFLRALDVTIAMDITGTFKHKAEEMQKGIALLQEKVASDDTTKNITRLNITAMSGVVLGTGFHYVTEIPPLDIIPGGTSPYPDYLHELSAVRDRDGIKNAIKAEMVFGDFKSSGMSARDLETEVERYRKYQIDNDVHTFVVTLNDGVTPINYDLAKRVSAKHDIFDNGAGDIETVIEMIFTLLKSAAKDPSSLARTKSLDMAELQAKYDALSPEFKPFVYPPGYVPQPGEPVMWFGGNGKGE